MPLFLINFKFVIMKKITFIFNLSVLVLLTAYGCSSSDSEDINNPNNNNNNNTLIPTNLVVSLDIQGQDANNPNGDGSGVLNFQFAWGCKRKINLYSNL